HRVMEDFHAGWEQATQGEQRSLPGLLAGGMSKLATLLQASVPLFLLPVVLIALPWLWRDRRLGSILVLGLLFTAGLLVETWMHPHYAAPAAGLVLLVIVASLRRLRVWRWQGLAAGRFLTGAVLVLFVLSSVSFSVALSRVKSAGWNIERARIL